MNNDLDSSRGEGTPMRRQRRSGRVVNGRDATGADTGSPGLPRVRKPARVRRLGAVDVAELRAHVERLSERVWQQEDEAKENNYFCFAWTRHIVFRFIPDNRTPLQFYVTPIGAAWQRLLLPVMEQAAAPYDYASPIYPKAMLARLAAGGRILSHTDTGTETGNSHAFTHKIHVPLQTNPRATLIVGDADFHLEAGHAFEVNNLAPHGALNAGAHDRVHLIFEVFDGSCAAGGADVSNRWSSRRLAGGPVMS